MRDRIKSFELMSLKWHYDPQKWFLINSLSFTITVVYTKNQQNKIFKSFFTKKIPK